VGTQDWVRQKSPNHPGLNSSPSHSGLDERGALAFGLLAGLKPGLYRAFLFVAEGFYWV
jgi:hypothetical protein